MEKIIRKARTRRIALEVNAHPDRLDLLDTFCQMAKQEGASMVIDSDAHSAFEFDNLRFGIGQARRGWVEKADVINTRSLKQLRTWLQR
jgi:DNA polymerase (family 10)